MVQGKSNFRAALVANSALIALVPASKIGAGWCDDLGGPPSITLIESNNYNDDLSFLDDVVKNDVLEIDVHVFTAQNTSTATIVAAISAVAESAGWVRDSCMDIDDPERYGHKYIRFSRRVFR